MPTTSTSPTAVHALAWSTLLHVELRKAVDTRSGRGLLAATGAAVVGILTWKATHADVAVDVHNYVLGVAAAVGFLAPVIGLLAMTSEWTQRTALTTFTLAPRRAPVLAAKVMAAWLVSLAAMAIGAVLAVAAVAVAGALHGSPDFGGLAGDLRTGVVLVTLQVLMGAAFGALAGATPVALGVYFLAPTVWANVSLGLFGDAAPWFDVFAAFDRLVGGDPFGHLAQTASSVALWILLPAVAGTIRALRREP